MEKNSPRITFTTQELIHQGYSPEAAVNHPANERIAATPGELSADNVAEFAESVENNKDAFVRATGDLAVRAANIANRTMVVDIKTGMVVVKGSPVHRELLNSSDR